LENLQIVLKASGSGLEHIVKVNIYLANMPRDFQLMNGVYAEVRAIFHHSGAQLKQGPVLRQGQDAC